MREHPRVLTDAGNGGVLGQILMGIDGVVVTGLDKPTVLDMLRGCHGSTVTLSLKDPKGRRDRNLDAAVITRTAGAATRLECHDTPRVL